MVRKRTVWILWISIILPLLLLALPARIGKHAGRTGTRLVDGVKQGPAASYFKLPLSFELNRGQSDPRVKFLSRGRGYALFLTGSEAVLELEKPSVVRGPLSVVGTKGSRALSVLQQRKDNGRRTTNSVLRLKLLNANQNATVTGTNELPGKSNYFLGNDPKKWRTNVPTYAKVNYENIYPGVDLVYYGNQRQLEYDFVVARGADPKVIRLAFDSGVEAGHGVPLRIDARGDLVLQAEGGEVRLQKPVVYQPMTGDAIAQIRNRKSLDGGYLLLPGNRVGFEIPNYDKTKPLVIDPVLSYSTYLGGSGVDGGSSSVSIAVDSFGNAYVASGSASTNFPVTTGAFQTTSKGALVCNTYYPCGDAVVAKIDPTGSELIYSTYLGGSEDDYAYGLAVDFAGNAYVTGVTSSPDFPTTPGVFQTSLGGGYDIFVTKLNPTGSRLVYSTYLGGSEDEGVQALALDSFGDAYVAGSSSSPNFPTTEGAYDTQIAGQACGTTEAPAPCADAIVTKLNPTGTALIYSTFLGGDESDAAYALAVDSSGAAYVAGSTNSTNFPTTQGAFQSSLATGTPCSYSPGGPTWPCNDIFVTKLNPQGSALLYSTYLGGSGDEYPPSMAVDSSGNAYVVGLTSSNNFPTTPGAFQTTFTAPYVPGCYAFTPGTGCAEAFVAKINPMGTGPASLVYSTYLGGSGSDWGCGIAVDSSGNAYVTGWTNSIDFPVTADALQPANAGGYDVFVTVLNPAGSRLISSTYLGGSGNDLADSIGLYSSGTAYLGGWTESENFPTTPGVFQPTFGGARDLFIAKIFYGISQPLIPGGGTNVYSFDNNLFNFKVTYPALQSPPTTPVYLVVDPISISQADLNARLAGQFAGATLVPYAGTGGYGVLFRATCTDSSGNPVTCPQTTGLNTFYTSWNSPAGQTISCPAFLMAQIAPVGSQTWTNIFTSYSQMRIDPTVSGRTKPGFSDFVVVQGICGTPPTITINSPTNTTYALHQRVPANYQCSGSFVVGCYGNVPNGSDIDTSTRGTHTFTVNAVVSSGPTAAKSVTYHVATTGICLLYDQTKAAKSGCTIPIKLQLCDANGNDVSSSRIVLTATGVQLVGPAEPTGVMDSGNANPDNNFRFDNSLGPTGGYIFNLSTKGLGSGSYNLNFTVLGDPTPYIAPFQVE